MLRFQSFLGLNVAGICIQRHIIGNAFYLTFTNVVILSHFNFLNVFKNSFCTILHLCCYNSWCV